MSEKYLVEHYQKEKDYLICIDSDGCAFDTMEIKWKECFIPAMIDTWGLQPISKYVRETAEYVNLYSNWRGINRFPGLIKVFDILAKREEVKERKFELPNLDPLRQWIAKESKLSTEALEVYVNETHNPIMIKTLEWTRNVNSRINSMVHDVPPFPYVRNTMEKIKKYADIIVVSSANHEAIKKEWQEHDLEKYTKMLCGQEIGLKNECIHMAKNHGYKNEKILMIGDALGDLKAAKDNDVLFYPIIAGKESFSWKMLNDDTFDRFINGQYSGEYEDKLIKEFRKFLPATLPWKLE